MIICVDCGQGNLQIKHSCGQLRPTDRWSQADRFTVVLIMIEQACCLLYPLLYTGVEEQLERSQLLKSQLQN